ncbi:hypothetical protein ACLOJK_019229 [Asimina triloba]
MVQPGDFANWPLIRMSFLPGRDLAEPVLGPVPAEPSTHAQTGHKPSQVEAQLMCQQATTMAASG